MNVIDVDKLNRNLDLLIAELPNLFTQLGGYAVSEKDLLKYTTGVLEIVKGMVKDLPQYNIDFTDESKRI